MEQFLLEAAKTNSPSVIFCALMIVGVYYLIKGQREKTATKRDNEKQTLEMAIALQAKDIENQAKEIENLKSQINMLSGRWDTLQEILGKINENLSAIRENISSFEKRLDRVEREKFNQS